MTNEGKLLPCPLCNSEHVSRWSVGKTVQCNSCGCAADLHVWNCRRRAAAPAQEPVAWRWRPTNNPYRAHEWTVTQENPAGFNRWDIEYEPLFSLTGEERDAWDAARGGAPDATGELSSEEFIRKQRDEEWR